MGIFDKIKTKVGLGGGKIKIILKNEEHSFNQGDTIIGKVELTGGTTNQLITNINLKLIAKFTEVIEEIHEYADGSTVLGNEDIETNTETLDEIIEDNPTNIGKDFHKKLEFEFNIPYNIDISMENELQYFIYAVADIKNGLDLKDTVNITINPSYEIQSIESLLEERFAFEFINEFSQNGSIMAEFSVPKRKFSHSNDNVGLAMINGENGIELELYPELSGMSFGEFIRSGLTHDNVKYQVELSYDQVITKSGEIDTKIVTDTFKRVFKDLNW